jgi:hypothetical protein
MNRDDVVRLFVRRRTGWPVVDGRRIGDGALVGGLVSPIYSLFLPADALSWKQKFLAKRWIVAVPEAGEDWSPTPVPGADQAALARVAASQVPAALHRLPVAQRQVLALAYFGGHTQNGIAVQTVSRWAR